MADTYNLQVLLRAKSEGMGVLKEAESGLGGIAKAGVALSAVLGVALVAGVAAGMASVVKLGIAYQDQMNTLQAVTGATAVQMKAMGAKAIELGNDLSLPNTSAAGAATAMLELAKAGLSVVDSMAAAKATLQLATAATISEGQAATYVATALNAFHLRGTDAIRVADLLAAAANASAGSVGDMGNALQMSAAVFASAKVPIQDVVTMISELANSGMQGSDAGTSLKQMLLALETPSKQQTKIMAQYHIELYKANGQMKDMRTFIGELSSRMGPLTQKQRDYALGVIFGSDAIRAANILVGQGIAGFDAMSLAVNKQGAAADVAAAKSKGLGGALRGLQSQWETIQLLIFEKVSPALDAFVRQISTQIVPVITDWVTNSLPKLLDQLGAFVGWVEKLGPPLAKIKDYLPLIVPFVAGWAAAQLALNIQLAAAGVMTIWALVGPYVGIVLAARSATELWAAAQLLLDAALAANPIGLVVFAITALVVGVIWAYQNVGWFRYAVDALWGALKAFATQFWSDVKPVLDFLGPVFHTIADAVGAFKDQFWADIKPIFDWLGPVLQNAISWLGQLAQALGLAASTAPGAANYSAAAHARTFPVRKAASGFEGTVYQPTLFLAGEGGAPEDVRIGPKGSGGDMGGIERRLDQLIALVMAQPTGQTGTEAALWKAVQGAGLNRLRGGAGA